MRPPRTRARTYLALARVSNLPTIWTNVLAGMVLVSVRVDWFAYTLAAIGMSLIYCAGMVYNDVADADSDSRERPDRPIPAGDLTRADATAFGGWLMGPGAGLLFVASHRKWNAFWWTVVLALAIQYYNWRHKRDPLGPVVMGICRGLVYCCAAAIVGHVDRTVVWGALIMTAYVTALTLVAKFGGATYGWSIKWLIACICVVDAAMIAWAGAPELAVVALLGVPATIAAQRLVSGT